ncbi:MAG: hypothetical protein AAFW60_01140, partial [Pseudomonadota bacterium]
MQKACRGVVLAAGLISLPILAQADCPPEDSIDRYTETAGDALSALHELVPESQQQALEDRYSAMVILKWQWQGRDAIRNYEKGMTQVLGCYQNATCGIRANDQITTQIVARLEDSDLDPLLFESLIPQQPSAQSLAWAERVLGCTAPALTPNAPILVETAIENTLDDAVIEAIEVSATEPEPANTNPIVVETASLDTALAEPSNADETDLNLPVSQSVSTVSASIDLSDSEPSSIVEAGLSETESRPLDSGDDVTTDEVARPVVSDVNDLMLTATNLLLSGKPKDAIEPLQTACFIEAFDSSKSSACETLFNVYTNSVAASEYSDKTQDYRNLSQRLCESGYSRGCDNLSRYYAAQNSQEALTSAVDYAEQSCALNSAEACATVANFYLSGRVGEPDPIAARAKLEQSCRLGRLLSCQEVADYYARGIGGEPDPAMALQMIEASCPDGSTERA